MRVTWIGHTGLYIKSEKATVLIDPYFLDSCARLGTDQSKRMPKEESLLNLDPDFLLFTHRHLNYDDPDTAALFIAEKKSMTVLSPSSVWREVRKNRGSHNYVRFDRGSVWNEKGLRFTAVRAEYDDEYAIGFLIEETATRELFYVTGDTLYNEEIFADIPTGIDAVFLPVNGTGNNMNPTDAAKFAKRVGAKVAVPIHWGVFDSFCPDDFPLENKIIPEFFREIPLPDFSNYYEVAGHEPSLLPKGREFSLVWQDEFDGTELNTEKWDYRVSMMGKNHPAWTDKGVHLDGKSNCVFTLMTEDGRPVSSQLQTGYNFMDQPTVPTKFGTESLQWNIGKLHKNKFTHKYGYFECRCRLQQKKGWWSAFWLQSPVIGASDDPSFTGTEVDVMESFEPGKVLPHNCFTGGYGLDMKRRGSGEGATLDPESFHRFGVLWDENGYTFYIDGKEDGHNDRYISACPEFVLISTEVMGYRNEDHQPLQAAFDAVGDTFLVDYVRVFDIKK